MAATQAICVQQSGQKDWSSAFNAYAESRTLSPEEIQAIPILALANRAGSAALFRYRERDGDDVCSVLRRSVAVIRGLIPQLRQVASTFGWSPST